ncbi:MAG: family 20 glycosylhydrolase, partial [Bacteroidales bacterium]|nr:family 20 glycosylhydrolase [Bacteroidales bacterium]
LKPGEEIRITYRHHASIINYTLSPVGPYFVFEDNRENEIKRFPVEDFTILPVSSPEVSNRSRNDKVPVPDAEWRFARNKEKAILTARASPPLVPSPVSVRLQTGVVTIDKTWEIVYASGLVTEAGYLAGFLKNYLDIDIKSSEGAKTGKNIISIATGQAAGKAEGYKLSIDNNNGIQITGADKAGVFFGIQTLLALFPVEAFQHPSGSIQIRSQVITDAPAFRYRGMHFDVARNFNKKEVIMKLIDVLAFYKMNRLHLHLTDDEGWRIEIEELPELTEIGAFRGHTDDEKDHLMPAYGSGPEPDPENSYGSGFYTREEFKEILRYAYDRHIEVIPEINFPGHARAAIKSMEVRYERLMDEGKQDEAEKFRLIDPDDKSVYNSAQNYNDNVVCVCRESVFNFYTTVIDDIVEMYREAGVPLNIFHTGGDEVPMGSWLESPMCEKFLQEHTELGEAKHLQAYFLRRARKALSERGILTAGWEEIVMKKLERGEWEPIAEFAEQKDVIPYVWNNLTNWEDLSNRLANAGFPVVLCAVGNFYFDLAYYKEFEEPGHYWGGFVNTRDAFQFVPYDLFMSTKKDNMGNVFDYETHFEGMEKLKTESRKNILGLQGQLWSETVKGGEMAEYYYLPKLLGLAERAWSGQPSWASISDKQARDRAEEQAWNAFAITIGKRELPRLDVIFGGYNYRIPLTGAVIEEGTLHANIRYPGLVIRYTTDGSEPDISSRIYEGPVEVSGTVKLKAFNTTGRSSRTSVVK